MRSHFVLSPLLQKPGCHVPQSILHRARMIALAKEESIAYWRKELPHADETELEMMYTHLSNGLMHVVVEGYDKLQQRRNDPFCQPRCKSQSFAVSIAPKSSCLTQPLCPNGIISLQNGRWSSLSGVHVRLAYLNGDGSEICTHDFE